MTYVCAEFWLGGLGIRIYILTLPSVLRINIWPIPIEFRNLLLQRDLNPLPFVSSKYSIISYYNISFNHWTYFFFKKWGILNFVYCIISIYVWGVLLCCCKTSCKLLGWYNPSASTPWRVWIAAMYHHT